LAAVSAIPRSGCAAGDCVQSLEAITQQNKPSFERFRAAQRRLSVIAMQWPDAYTRRQSWACLQFDLRSNCFDIVKREKHETCSSGSQVGDVPACVSVWAKLLEYQLRCGATSFRGYGPCSRTQSFQV